MTGRRMGRDWISAGGLAIAVLAGLPTLASAQSERLPGGIERAPGMPDSAAPMARGLRPAPPKPSTAPPPAVAAPPPPPAAAPAPAPTAPPAPKSDKSGAAPSTGPAVAQALDPKDGKAPKPPKTTAPQSSEKVMPQGSAGSGSGSRTGGPAVGAPAPSRGLSGGSSERRPGGIERVQGKE